MYLKTFNKGNANMYYISNGLVKVIKYVKYSFVTKVSFF